ncbi:MAG: hypothetical protein QM605_02680 [Sphingobium sp.]
MDCNDDDRSLRRIALRILNEDERQAQDEVDEVIQGIDGYLGTQSRLYAWPIPITIVFPVFFLIMSRLASLYSATWENILFGIALLACFLPFGILWYWRRDQYGSGRLWKPREAIYADASDETRETLERLFAYLRLESSPKIYFLDRKGVKQYPDRGYVSGSLRVLLLSNFAAVRALCLSPDGKRISEVIKVDADPDEVIKALGIKPKRAGGPGRNIKYAYAEAIFDLRGDPRLDTLDLTDEAGAARSITDWLLEWFQSAANVSADVPDRKLLIPYARKIFNHLKKRLSPEGR